jgi:hypothetical protein
MVPKPTFITRVILEKYRSIAKCDVRLGPLTFLVGPNGAGKSNFLDALRFVSDALITSLERSLWDRGGSQSLLTRISPAPSGSFGIRLEFDLGDGFARSLCLPVPCLAGWGVRRHQGGVPLGRGQRRSLFGLGREYRIVEPQDPSGRFQGTALPRASAH